MVAALIPASVATAQAPGGTAVLAGTGSAGYSGDGDAATAAELDHPAGVAATADGAAYIGDAGNHVVRMVSTDGTITTAAGTGTAGAEAIDPEAPPAATEADLSLPTALAVAADGTVYIADAGLRQVLKFSTDGPLEVVAGTGEAGFSGDGGPAVEAKLGTPQGIAVADDGTVYLSDQANARVRAVSPDGTITTVAGNGDAQVTAAGGTATEIPVPAPGALALDQDQALWIVDGGLLHRLSDNTFSTLALPTATTWALADDADWPPTDPPANNITAVASDADGAVHYTDGSAGKIYRPSDDGGLSTAATPSAGLDGALAIGAPGLGYLVDNSANQVHTVTLADNRSGDPAKSWPLWPFVAAGVLAAVLVIWLIARRRRA